jgi:hypothetical protein
LLTKFHKPFKKKDPKPVEHISSWHGLQSNILNPYHLFGIIVRVWKYTLDKPSKYNKENDIVSAVKKP